ncbi:hypothetical protein [Streptomyces rubradiris]|uniref:CU044_5270 family protein n=1 Tax=Streptomyces rubradiris TaxID=285531 RepID=A0ABQ3RM25_STRRR|nr:hypothetical protein [Streptomyces rubradiris]GHH04123.1 hypothetical protein GCM10018792_21400 [Streptomyces rubradiris]GHI56921.1 hypothetical protein Srubr_67670 [Streptomyces rubradiris]
MTEQTQRPAPEQSAPQEAVAPEVVASESVASQVMEPEPVPGRSPLPAVAPPAAAVRKDRRALRAALRWTAVAAVFCLVGAGSAYGVSRMERTDLPGLATASDGRWDYPELVRPPLPPGSPGPLEASNRTGTHYADLRALVLPAPRGATVEPGPGGTDGWLPVKDFLADYATGENRRELAQKLTDHGLRRIAGRGWTTPDGTRTRIRLLRFGTATVSETLLSGHLANAGAPIFPVRGAEYYALDETFPPGARMKGVTLFPYTEAEPYGAEQVRQAYFVAGDTIAVITQTRKGGVNAVPFRQTVTLQTELLS